MIWWIEILIKFYRCVTHIVQVVFGRIIGEKAQLAACKEMTVLICRYLHKLNIYFGSKLSYTQKTNNMLMKYYHVSK